MTFLERLKELQIESGLNYLQIAKGSGIPYSTLDSYRNRGSVPSMNQLIALSDFFGCSIDYLVGREDDLGNIVAQGQTLLLTKNESILVNYYKQLSDERQKNLIEVAEGLVLVENK